jgi:hypothetical protein
MYGITTIIIINPIPEREVDTRPSLIRTLV